jgi:hypothetical protein
LSRNLSASMKAVLKTSLTGSDQTRGDALKKVAVTRRTSIWKDRSRSVKEETRQVLPDLNTTPTPRAPGTFTSLLQPMDRTTFGTPIRSPPPPSCMTRTSEAMTTMPRSLVPYRLILQGSLVNGIRGRLLTTRVRRVEAKEYRSGLRERHGEIPTKPGIIGIFTTVTTMRLGVPPRTTSPPLLLNSSDERTSTVGSRLMRGCPGAPSTSKNSWLASQSCTAQ